MTNKERWESAEKTLGAIIGKLLKGELITKEEYTRLGQLNKTHEATVAKFGFKRREERNEG